MFTLLSPKKVVDDHVKLRDFNVNFFSSNLTNNIFRCFIICSLVLGAVTAYGHEKKVAPKFPELKQKGAHGPGESERSGLTTLRENSTTNYEDKNTNLPFYSHKDYLLTSSPVKYSLLFTLRQKLERGRFLLHVRAVENSLAETLFSVVIQNRTVFFSQQ